MGVEPGRLKALGRLNGTPHLKLNRALKLL